MGASEQGRRGPSSVAALLVRSRAALIVDDWQQAAPTSRSIDHAAILEVVVEGLTRCEGTTRSAHHHGGLPEIFAAHADELAVLDAETITSLRDAVRRHVIERLNPYEALVALHCTSTVLDQLMRTTTEWSSAALQRLVYVDELTGLANRRAANDALQPMLAQAIRHHRELVAVVIDVDHLKIVNDREGHDSGDRTLRRLADAFRSGLREGDRAFRTGGDEFLVLLPDTGLGDVEGVMARVRRAGAPSFSFGAASAPGEADVALDLLRLADQRLLGSRRTRRTMPEPPPVRSSSSELPASIAVLAAVVVALLTAGDVVGSVWAGISVAVFGCAAGALVLATASRSPHRHRQLSDALFMPMVVYALSSFFLHALSAVDPPWDSAQVQRANRSMTATSSGDSAMAEAGEKQDRPASRATTSSSPAAAPSIPTIPSTTSTTTSTTSTSSTTTTTFMATVTAANPTTTTEAPAPSTTSTTVREPPPTTTTTSPPAPPNGRRAKERGVAVPLVQDDQVRAHGQTINVRVLGNDRAADGEDGDIDPASVAITTAALHGSVEVLPSGLLRYRSSRHRSDDRFRYRVCTVSGGCAEAWVNLERQNDAP